MKKTGIASGLVTLFAVAAIGAVVADAAGYLDMQRFDLTIAQKHKAAPRSDAGYPAVEDAERRIFVLRGGMRESSDAMFERLEEGQTYCAVKGTPVFMRKPSQPSLIAIHANGPCP